MKEALDGVVRPVLALENQYTDGDALAAHHHERGQLLYGASGAVMVRTVQGTWVMPPQRGIWIPPGVVHEVRMLGEVRTYSLYLEPEASASMPTRCEVVGITRFMRSLMCEAVELSASYDLDGRAGALMTLIQYEMKQLSVLPLSLPIPAHDLLAKRCRDFLGNPSPHDTIDQWSDALGVSRHTFTRLFRRETGMSLAAWRQQACLIVALPRLIAGERVTSVALELGYDNPAAFTTMFKRVLGTSPRNYLSLRKLEESF